MALSTSQIGVCSWSLQVKNVPELTGFLKRLDIDLVQIACGDPHHAAWDEGDQMPAAARTAGFRMCGAMLGFPGEDYTTPATIERTGGFGDPATRPERLETLKWGLQRTQELGLSDMTLHAGFIPDVGSSERKAFLDTISKVAELAHEFGVTIAFETGQESSELLLATMKELESPKLRINFDPANMLLYDKDDPIAAIERLGPYIRSVHAKDANRPTMPGVWGKEVPLGTGETNTKLVMQTLNSIGFTGPILIEREVGYQEERYRDIAHGVQFLQGCINELAE